MKILAINPWIYDFAAYDFWLKPYGFLVILEYLKQQGFTIDYIDCLNKKETLADYGRGKYHNEIIEKPAIFKDIPRYYKRYGITSQEFRQKLTGQNPDLILITSSMTYWYPAIIEIIKMLRENFSNAPIVVGGTYATLCYEHAKKTIPADYIFRNDQLDDFFNLIKIKVNQVELFTTLPDYNNFYSHIDYAVFRSSWGCPFNCSYCALKKLFSHSFRLTPEKIIEFITKYAKKGLKDFVLYDDAFLYEHQHAKDILQRICDLNLNIRFHTPNALHLRFLDEEMAVLLKKTGFTNPHFGLETLDEDLQKSWGDKVNREDLVKAFGYLKKAGFRNGEFSVYLLLGYPGQNLQDLKEDIEFINRLGGRTSFAEYSPVPETRLFQEYPDKFKEPLLQNNSVFGAFSEGRIKEFWEIKNYLRELNKKLKDNH